MRLMGPQPGKAYLSTVDVLLLSKTLALKLTSVLNLCQSTCRIHDDCLMACTLLYISFHMQAVTMFQTNATYSRESFESLLEQGTQLISNATVVATSLVRNSNNYASAAQATDQLTSMITSLRTSLTTVLLAG